MTETIKDFYGSILGYISRENDGRYMAKSFYGKILGYYDPRTNETRDFYGKILTRGNILSHLICVEANLKL